MKSIKRTLLVLFTLACIVGAIVALAITSSAANNKYFDDVVSGSWYEEKVNYAFEHGYMAGTADARFEPESTLTRAMMVKIMANLQDVDTAPYAYSQSFSDVAKGKWYHEAIE